MLFSYRRPLAVVCMLLITILVLAGKALADQPEPQIVGGQEAAPGEYPWQVALVGKGPDLYNGAFCGGSLIHRRWVVTAAHCVEGSTLDDQDVVAGIHDLDNPNPNFARATIEQIVIHPGWDPVSNDNDIALLKLATPMDERAGAGTTLPIAHLDLVAENAGTLAGAMATVTGWGNMQADPPGGSNFPDRLQEVSLPIITNAACNIPYGGDITDNMLCAAVDGGGKDSCQGDSGGPLVVFDSGQSRWELAGVVSYGIGCADANFPGVYTRVSRYTGWINTNVLVQDLPYHAYLPATFNITAAPPASLVNGDFEAGADAGWTEYSSNNFHIVLNDFDINGKIVLYPHSGIWAAWLGGFEDETSILAQQLTVNAGAPFLTYYHIIGSEEVACGNDTAGVSINGATVKAYDLCDATETGDWVKQSVNLAAYAGQSVLLEFWANTDGVVDTNSNWFLDDVAMAASAAAAGAPGQAGGGVDSAAPRR